MNRNLNNRSSRNAWNGWGTWGNSWNYPRETPEMAPPSPTIPTTPGTTPGTALGAMAAKPTTNMAHQTVAHPQLTSKHVPIMYKISHLCLKPRNPQTPLYTRACAPGNREHYSRGRNAERSPQTRMGIRMVIGKSVFPILHNSC